MISAQRFQPVRKPWPEAETLPAHCYHSAEFHALETEHIFLKKWILIGRTDEWTITGACKNLRLFDIPFLVVRGEDGALRAFANSCRHRGSALIDGDTTVARFVCPYHSWTYGLDGSLRGAPGMEGNPSFDKDQYGLAPIRLDVWQSFVFVNFSADGPSLSEQLGDLTDYLAPYDFANVATVGGDEYVVKTNWKALVENSMEWLHHATVHKQSIAGKVAKIERNLVIGEHADYLIVQSLADGVSRATLENETGFPAVSTLTGAARHGSHYALLYPFAMIGCDVDSIWFKQMIPEGPGKVRLVARYCFHKETMARPDFQEKLPIYLRRFRKVMMEDSEAMERQLAGLTSPLAQPGRYSDREVLVHQIDNWVLDQIFSRPANIHSQGTQ